MSDTAKLHWVGGNGNALIEEGKASGSLPGTARVILHLSATTATSSFTLRLGGGSVTGHGTAKLHPGRSGRFDSFGGSASISGGSGRYRRVSGSGGFYGVIDRSNYSAEVQVLGKLHY